MELNTKAKLNSKNQFIQRTACSLALDDHLVCRRYRLMKGNFNDDKDDDDENKCLEWADPIKRSRILLIDVSRSECQ